MKRILFFGDSNTYGFCPVMGGPERYPREVRWTGILQKKYRNRFEILDYGFNGLMIPQDAYRLEHARSILESQLDLDLYAVMLGTNDMLNMFCPREEEVASHMRDFLKKIHGILEEHGAEDRTKILLIAPPLLHFDDEPYMGEFSTTDGELSRQYEKVAKDLGIHFVDAAKWELSFGHDKVHLSEEGHKTFAQKMGEYLETLFPE